MQTGRQQLTSAGVIKMFRINWSPTGSNRRRVEEEDLEFYVLFVRVGRYVVWIC